MPKISMPPIVTAPSGFYKGFNKTVTIVPKIIVGALIIWAGFFPTEAGNVLARIQIQTTSLFGAWYIYVTAFYLVTCLLLALWPKSAAIRLGSPGEKPEFSKFSWFSMMFGAGIGIGMLTYSTAEPIFHFANNPDVIMGNADGLSENNIHYAYKWALLHYGLTPWGCYSIVGMALAYFSYNRGLPLTIRTALQPILGNLTSGPIGNIIDIVAIIATIIGVGVTIGYGVSQFAFGMHHISGADWIIGENGKPAVAALLIALGIVMVCSMLSAMSGVGRGIKWLSNINMALSIFLLAFFAIFGATLFAFKEFFIGTWTYLVNLPMMSVTVWENAGTPIDSALAAWQGDWTIFYWAWWIAFAPFVGLFLARVSRGRTIREYVLGAMIVPSLMCFTWFFLIGGTAISLELSGIAKGAIVNADLSAQLYETINLMLTPDLAIAMSVVIVTLLLTYLVTSADSAILIINTIASGGDDTHKQAKHIIIWSIILTSVVAALLVAGGMDALRSAMIIGALPFSIVVALMALALVKALIFDDQELADPKTAERKGI